MLFLASVCPICETGARGFRLCSDQQTVVVMCDECEALWLNARRIQASDAVYAKAPDFRPPSLACSIAAPMSRWATLSEVQAVGWDDLILGEGTALDGG